MTDLRGQDEAEAIKTLIRREIAQARTALPGTVISFDADTQMATLQPNIRRVVINGGEQTGYWWVVGYDI